MADDRKDLLEDAASRALLAAGRDAAKRAALDLLSPDAESAAREASKARGSKTRRWKLIAAVVLGACLVVGVIGMLVSYWQWFLLAGLLGVAVAFGWWRLGKRLAARKNKAPERIESAEAPRIARAVRAADEPRAKRTAIARAAPDAGEPGAPTPADDAAAAAEAAASEEQAVEDELAAMKARLGRSRARDR